MVKKRLLLWETLSTLGGGQQMTLTIADMLGEQWDILCLIPGEGRLSEELKKRGIPYVCMGDQTLPAGVKGKSVLFRYGWMSLKNIWKSLAQIRRFRPDVLYAPGPAALPWSAVCGALTGKPVIWHLHHIFQDGPTKKLLNFCGKWKTVKKIIAISRCVGEQITSDAKEKLEIFYNPVDCRRFAEGNGVKVRRELEKALDISLENRVVVGHIGLIQRMKRQDFVLSVLKSLRKQGVNAVGLFAGECREQDYMDELQHQLRSENLDVLFLGRREDIPDVLKAMDVLLIPSVEGFSLAGEEAAAAGVPVVACDVAGAAELVEKSGNGLTYPEHDSDSATRAICEILPHRHENSSKTKEFVERLDEACYALRMKELFSNVK